MKNLGYLSRFGVLAVIWWNIAFLNAATVQTPAQQVNVGATAASIEELSQADLVKAYRQLREELHATQIAFANSRAEADAAARAQATAFADRLATLKVSVDAERERQQLEIARSNAERDRQEEEMRGLTKTILWVAAVFGGVGLVVMLLTPYFQWRAVNSMTELAGQRAQSPAYSLMAPEPTPAASDQTVALSNERLMSVVERMERRIHEMENTAAQPLPGTGAKASTVTSVNVSSVRAERNPSVRPH